MPLSGPSTEGICLDHAWRSQDFSISNNFKEFNSAWRHKCSSIGAAPPCIYTRVTVNVFVNRQLRFLTHIRPADAQEKRQDCLLRYSGRNFCQLQAIPGISKNSKGSFALSPACSLSTTLDLIKYYIHMTQPVGMPWPTITGSFNIKPLSRSHLNCCKKISQTCVHCKQKWGAVAWRHGSGLS